MKTLICQIWNDHLFILFTLKICIEFHCYLEMLHFILFEGFLTELLKNAPFLFEFSKK
jgi:hypothetical protein